MRKIVYLIQQPLDKRNYDRFGIQVWINRGWEVEIWDLTAYTNSLVWENFHKTKHKLKKFRGYFPISNKNQLSQAYKRLMNVKYYIDLAGDDLISIKVKLVLKKMGVKRVSFSTGAIPVPRYDIRLRRLKSKIKSGAIEFCKWFVSVLLCKFAAIFIKPGIIVVSGQSTISSHLAWHSQKVLKAHSLDYDIYLDLSKSIKDADEEYAVFIDSDYCFHSDYIYLDEASPATPGNYFPAISKGLRKIANSLGVSVIVAAHPRSSYQQTSCDYFDGLPIKYGNTAKLIRDCKFVVCHDSTAVQFAVLFQKPIIFITTDELNRSTSGRSISLFASELGKSALNMNGNCDNIDWKNELFVDSRKYDEFRSKYIKMDGSPQLPSWDILANYIEKCD